MRNAFMDFAVYPSIALLFSSISLSALCGSPWEQLYTYVSIRAWLRIVCTLKYLLFQFSSQSKGFRVLALDLYGRGHSPFPRGKFEQCTVHLLTQQLSDLLAALRLNKVSIDLIGIFLVL